MQLLSVGTERAQYGLLKEYALDRSGIPNMISGIFLHIAILGSMATHPTMIFYVRETRQGLQGACMSSVPFGDPSKLYAPLLRHILHVHGESPTKILRCWKCHWIRHKNFWIIKRTPRQHSVPEISCGTLPGYRGDRSSNSPLLRCKTSEIP